MNGEKPKEAAKASQAVYPDPEEIKKGKQEQSGELTSVIAKDPKYQQASRDFTDLIVLGAGIGSTVFLLGLIYLLDNMWIPYISSAILATISILSSLQNFKNARTLTPLTVIGLSAATFSLMYIANFLIAQAVIRSSNSLY